MLTIQNDTVDLMARDITPHVTKLATEMLEVMSPKDSEKALEILSKLTHWYGDMSENSIGATVYATWQFHFYSSLFKNQIEDESVRLSIVANYPFIDYIQRMIHTLVEDPENENFNRICRGVYTNEYKGQRQCMYNIARAMAETYDFLTSNISPNSGDWMWKHVHVNEYPHIPLSFSPFKPLVHREVPIGGNGNTVKVSKYSFKRLKEMKTFKSTHTPNYKTVV
jgi:acyl-homoserine lactone acylase PvdQ